MPQLYTQPSLSIIIVSYNTAQLTLQAVNAVVAELKESQSLKDLAEIIIVDNHSTDDTIQQLKQLQKKTPQLSLIQNKKNLGFATANNLGIKQSKGRYILLLNSDTIVQPGSLQQLVTTFETHPIDEATASLTSQQGKLDKLGILAATLLNQDGTIQPQGGKLPTLVTLLVQMLFLDDLPVIGKFFPTVQETGRAGQLKHTLRTSIADASAGNQPWQTEWVCGAAMAIRRKLIKDIGILDENIFMYGEDIEFCLRAKKNHWDIAIAPQARIIHLGSASSSSDHAILGEFKAYLYIWAKHKPHWQMKFAKMILYFGAQLRRFLYGVILRDKKKAATYKKAKNLID